jgi:hypothetical protein
MSDSSKRLTYSEVKYGYLRIEKQYSNKYPKPGEKVTINGCEGDFKMHSTQAGRSDRLTKLYKKNRAKVGDIVHFSFCPNNELCLSFSDGKTLFEIESEEKKKTPLLSIIENIRELITNQTYLFCNNETNVRIELIEPILKNLGWNLHNMNREVKCKKSRKRADFALYDKQNVCILVIEAKSLDQPLLVKEFSDTDIQINNYMQDERFKTAKYVLLTNGQAWQIRDKSGQNIIKSIDILETNNENEKYDSSIIEFFEILSADKFDIAVDIPQETSPHQMANDRLFHFNIIQDNKKIPGKNPTEIFRNFIEKNESDVIKLQENNRLKVCVITQNYDQVRNPKQTSDKKYFTTGDHSTYLKKMLIQQIIRETNIDAIIEDIKE